MSVFGDRLKLLREEKGLTTEQLARELGVGRTALTNYETGKRRPKPAVMEAILDFFNVDLAWMDGKTEVRNVYNFDGIYQAGYKDGVKDTQKDSDLDQDEQDLVDDYRELYDWEKKIVTDLIKSLLCGNHSDQSDLDLVHYRTLPMFGARPSAGSGNYLPAFADLAQSELQVIDTTETEKATFALKVDGKSMEPKYKDGDVILVERAEVIEPGEIGVFSVNGNAVVKQCQNGYLHSLNPDYPDIHLTENDEVQCFGRVIGTV